MEHLRFRDAARQTDAWTAVWERRALAWLAARLPLWVGSDHLTLLALAAMATGGASYWLAGRVHPLALIGVVAALAVNWFGDSLDGTLARLRQQQRPRYGFYVDHIIDCVGTVFLMAGLGLSGYMSPLVASGVLAAYLLVSAEVYLATHCLTVFRMSAWGFGPTELRIVLAMGTLTLLFRPVVHVGGGTYLLFDVGGIIATAGMAVALTTAIVRNVRTLYLAEPLPCRGSREAA